MFDGVFTIRYRQTTTHPGRSLIVADAEGQLYACTDAGHFCHIPDGATLQRLTRRGWEPVADATPQSLDCLLRELTAA